MLIRFALVLLCFGAFVSANPGIFSDDVCGFWISDDGGRARETNAERFRRGLPPLPPTRRDSRNALMTRQSCRPLSNQRGVIKVTAVDTGASMGYISDTYDGQNSYTIAASLVYAATFSWASSTPFYGPSGLTVINGPDPNYPAFGAVGGSAGYRLAPGSYGLRDIGSHVGQWTNIDSTEYPNTFFYDGNVDSLDMTGDFAAFSAYFFREETTAVVNFSPKYYISVASRLTLSVQTLNFVPNLV
ncbi:hypothetical protein B0H11DRAFT_1920537 [Mycena galericulata]|nr:hypothetical protein B0H11DRAFT_1920537 [Mycena galericulata]